MLCVAWFMSSFVGKLFPYDAAVALITTFAAWLYAESQNLKTSGRTNKLHPHDVALGGRLRAAFGEETRRFLREHSFGQPFHMEKISAIEAVADDWSGAEFEFEDVDLDNLSSEIVRLSGEVANKIGEYAGIADRWPEGTLSVPLDHERARDEFSDNTWAHINELNQLAADLMSAIENFERAFRKKSPESYEVAR